MSNVISVDGSEEPMTVSVAGVEVYERGESVLLSTERLRETAGPDGIIIEPDELQNLAVDVAADSRQTGCGHDE